jgi:hypothetical protein
MEKLMDTYSRKFELDQYCTDPVKLAARDAMLGNVHEYFNETKPKKKGSKK